MHGIKLKLPTRYIPYQIVKNNLSSCFVKFFCNLNNSTIFQQNGITAPSPGPRWGPQGAISRNYDAPGSTP